VLGYLIPGFLVFMVIPAVVFWHIEDGWTYLDSLYFAFVTLTTIGFGDYVAGSYLGSMLSPMVDMDLNRRSSVPAADAMPLSHAARAIIFCSSLSYLTAVSKLFTLKPGVNV
jgi:hypothetical protein